MGQAGNADAVAAIIAGVIEALRDGAVPTPAALFDKAVTMQEVDYKADKDAPAAYVGLSDELNAGVASRLVTIQTYKIVVASRVGETDSLRKGIALGDAIIAALHGKNLGYDDIEAFRFESRRQEDSSGSRLIHALYFNTRHLGAVTQPG